jgi:hypothetical protein
VLTRTADEADGRPKRETPQEIDMGWITDIMEQIDAHEARHEALQADRIDWCRFEQLGGDIEEARREAVANGDRRLARRAARALARRR